MNELDLQVSKGVNLAIRSTTLSIKMITRLMMYLSKKGYNNIKGSKIPVRKLVGQGAIEDKSLNREEYLKMKKELNRYGIKFSVKKLKETKDYLIFFQSNDQKIFDYGLEKVVNKIAKKNIIKEKIQDRLEKLNLFIPRDKVIEKTKEKTL